jgi:hypothetical protein
MLLVMCIERSRSADAVSSHTGPGQAARSRTLEGACPIRCRLFQMSVGRDRHGPHQAQSGTPLSRSAARIEYASTEATSMSL